VVLYGLGLHTVLRRISDRVVQRELSDDMSEAQVVPEIICLLEEALKNIFTRRLRGHFEGMLDA